MFTIEAKTEIHATPEIVWEVITDLPAYADWNSQLFYLGGTLALGEKIKLKFLRRSKKRKLKKKDPTMNQNMISLLWISVSTHG